MKSDFETPEAIRVQMEKTLRQARYEDLAGRVLFVDTGIGRKWATYFRKPSGALKRVVSKHLPPRETMAEAEAEHDAKKLED